MARLAAAAWAQVSSAAGSSSSSSSSKPTAGSRAMGRHRLDLAVLERVLQEGSGSEYCVLLHCPPVCLPVCLTATSPAAPPLCTGGQGVLTVEAHQGKQSMLMAASQMLQVSCIHAGRPWRCGLLKRAVVISSLAIEQCASIRGTCKHGEGRADMAGQVLDCR